jgi:hypothetical protein
MKVVFQNPTFALQLIRTIGETYYKAADIGECLSTAYRIKEGDFESWHVEWLKTANRVHKYAEDCLAKGHMVSAREAYLRASNYYRVAESFYWIQWIREFKIPGQIVRNVLERLQIFSLFLLNQLKYRMKELLCPVTFTM